jgi:hypothetical protein
MTNSSRAARLSVVQVLVFLVSVPFDFGVARFLADGLCSLSEADAEAESGSRFTIVGLVMGREEKSE